MRTHQLAGLAAACALAAGLLAAPGARGVVVIEAPEDPVLTLAVARAEGDDAGDPGPAFADPHVTWVTVGNTARRWVYVWIDRIWTGAPTAPVDNGEDDRFLPPGAELTSIENVAAFFASLLGRDDVAYGWIVSERAYGLPIPAGVAPGQEVRFRVRVIGPAWLGTLPFPATGPDADPVQAGLLDSVTAWTLWQVLGGPALSALFSELQELRQFGLDIAAAYKDFAGGTTAGKKLWDKWEKGDVTGLVWEVVKFSASSATVGEILDRHGKKRLVGALQKLHAAWGATPVALGELTVALADLAEARWQEEYVVAFVWPRLDAVAPVLSAPGDTVTLTGAGFDPYVPAHNAVWFTAASAGGVPATILEGTVVEVPDEGTLRVKVPSGALVGPMKVCVDGDFCSNELTWGEATPSVRIVAPEDGVTLVDPLLTLEVELADMPPTFPDTAAVARLLVGGALHHDQQVSATAFTMSVDLSDQPAGDVVLEVEVEHSGYVFGDTVTVRRAVDLGAFNLAWLQVWVARTYTTTWQDGTQTTKDQDGAYISMAGQNAWQLGGFDGFTFSASWSLVPEGWTDLKTGDVSITVASDLSRVTAFDVAWGQDAAGNSLQRHATGKDVEAYRVTEDKLEFLVTGEAACDALTAFTDTDVAHYPDGDATSELTSWWCNASSKLLITFWALDGGGS